jgi:hypothetical protein
LKQDTNYAVNKNGQVVFSKIYIKSMQFKAFLDSLKDVLLHVGNKQHLLGYITHFMRKERV